MLKTIWRKIKSGLKRVALIQSKILLFLIYFVFITPIAILFKIFSDSLNLKKKASWLSAPKEDKGIENMKNQ